jgi:hypothetical protein
LWHDKNGTGWIGRKTYVCRIEHRPSTGLIRVQISHEGEVLIDSGEQYDTMYKGGRFGVYDLSQEMATFWDLKYTCGSMSVCSSDEGNWYMLLDHFIEGSTH